ncbi:MAG TPA: glycosyltransferase family 4 protein [Thermoleophilaceae bacterium]
MRVLYWTEQFWPHIGGVEVLSSNFIPAMRDRGHEFAVATSHSGLDLPDEDEWEGVPLRRFPFRQAIGDGDMGSIARATRGVAALKREFRPELVHVRMADPSVFFHLRTRDAHSCPLLVSVTNAPPEAGAGPGTLLDSVMSSAAWVTANSEAILEDVLRLAPRVRGRASVVHPAQVVPGVEPAPRQLDPPTILCLGRVVDEKGFDVAMVAFARVRRELPAARLVIAGDGPNRSTLEAQARDLGLEEAVSFRGWVPPERVPDLINEAAIVAIPSRWREAFCLVAVEGALMERPVVATNVGGLAEAVADGETGLLVPGDDPAAFADALLSLLRDPNRAAAMGRAGRARAIREFDHDAHVDAYADIYARLAA